MSNETKVLLVDGNNIIHAWEDLRELHQRRRGSAHAELCKRLTNYKDFSGNHVVVVFDGRGAKIEQEAESQGIQIFYTDSAHTADDIIEMLANKYARQYSIVVATNDRTEQDGVIAAGGEAISAEAFRDDLDRMERGFRSQWGL